MTLPHRKHALRVVEVRLDALDVRRILRLHVLRRGVGVGARHARPVQDGTRGIYITPCQFCYRFQCNQSVLAHGTCVSISSSTICRIAECSPASACFVTYHRQK
jgi:hypothetical protein